MTPRRLAPLLPALLLAACPPAAPSAAPPGPRPRVVTAAPALAEMVCALGAREHLVGVSRFCLQPAELGQLPRVGGIIDPDLETIDGLRPDLLLWQGRPENLRELAERRGARLETFRIETLDEVRQALRRLGELLGREPRAAAEIARLDAALAAAGVGPARPPVRTLLVLGHQPGDLSQIASAGPETFLSECLRAAGGENVLGDLPGGAWPYVAPEVLLRERPELIVELQPDPVDAARAAALRRDWQVLGALPAVERGRIAIVCGDEVLVPGPRLPSLIGKLARATRGELDVGLAAAVDPARAPTWPR
jgi:iron complex transport system substrate-binding protein